MAAPDLSLAIFAAVYEIGHFLAHVGQMISQVHDNRAKERCIRLREEVELIHTLLIARPQAIDSYPIASEARSCISEIIGYINNTISGTLLSEAVEVWWKKEYIKILAKAARLRERFTLELLTRTAFDPLTGGRPHATFQITDQSSIQFHGSTGRGIVDPYGNVICHELKESKFTQESLEIYPKLQERAYVQKLKGLAEINGRLYVFLQDCSSYPTLNKLYADRELPSDLVSRVEIALKIAQTIAWYHRSDVILKAIHDTSIVMDQCGDNKWTPTLTGLEHMRHVSDIYLGNLYIYEEVVDGCVTRSSTNTRPDCDMTVDTRPPNTI